MSHELPIFLLNMFVRLAMFQFSFGFPQLLLLILIELLPGANEGKFTGIPLLLISLLFKLLYQRVQIIHIVSYVFVVVAVAEPFAICIPRNVFYYVSL